MLTVEQIWDSHRTGRVRGNYEELRPDLVFGHEATMSLILAQLEEAGGPRLQSEKLFLVVDHFAPASSGEFADIVRDFRLFCRRYQLDYALFEGIGHRLMLESDRVVPGSLVIGADSHTTTIGGKGALGIGLGSTDILAVLMTGTVWLKKPSVARIRLTGSLPPGVETKDVVLTMLKDHGQAGFLGEIVEYVDESDSPLPPGPASVLTNMVVEMGSVSGLFTGAPPPAMGAASPGRELAINLSTIRSMAARPGAPDAVVPASALKAISIDTAVVGSCAAGGIEDLRTAGRLLSGRQVKQGVSLLVTPGTRAVFNQAIEEGLVTTLLTAGATLLNPSCGACGGIDKGIPAVGDVVVSTAPRNYESRTRPGSATYLASTATTVASAIAGRIVSPASLL